MTKEPKIIKTLTAEEWGERPVCYNGRYYNDIESFFDTHSELEEDEELPEHVTGTKELRLSLHAYNIVKNCINNLSFGFDDPDAALDPKECELTELQKFLDEWCARQPVVGWEQDDTILVTLPTPQETNKS